MNIFKSFREDIIAAVERLAAAGKVPAGLDTAKVTTEPPRESAHGDISTNVAMVLSKPAGLKPRDLAELVAAELRGVAHVANVEVAGPGFINLRLDDGYWRERLQDVLRAGTSYGDSTVGQGVAVNVEYVSANPTGPMHVGHCRGAVVGDALAALLAKAGFAVTKEYYINDAGAQVDVLARSAYLRYREALGEEIGDIPEGLYPGDYLKPVGLALAKIYGDTLLEDAEEDWMPEVRAFSIKAMMELIKGDLLALGVHHDRFSSERELVEAGAVEAALKHLEDKGLVYVGVLEPPKGKAPDEWEPRPQTLFKSSEFGDDVDRPLKKSDGSWTYFASDIAYHLDKYRRGFTQMIDVLGADHGGYVKRMQAAVKAISDRQADLDVKLCQMVSLLKNGEPVKMSKRAGTFVTLRDVVDEVGAGVVRFIMLTRKNDAQLDFDLAKVLEQSKDNPVFYVQYAHARAHSVKRHAEELFGGSWEAEALAGADISCLTDADEIALIRQMASWPRVVEGAAEAHEPHRVAFFLYDLASQFHALWNKGNSNAALRFLLPEDQATSRARMALVMGMATVIASGLQVLGVEPKKEMR